MLVPSAVWICKGPATHRVGPLRSLAPANRVHQSNWHRVCHKKLKVGPHSERVAYTKRAVWGLNMPEVPNNEEIEEINDPKTRLLHAGARVLIDDGFEVWRAG